MPGGRGAVVWRPWTGSSSTPDQIHTITTRHFAPRVRASGSFAAPSPSFPTCPSGERETSGQRQAKDPGQPAGGGPAHQAPGPASPAGRGTHRGGKGQGAGHEGRKDSSNRPPTQSRREHDRPGAEPGRKAPKARAESKGKPDTRGRRPHPPRRDRRDDERSPQQGRHGPRSRPGGRRTGAHVRPRGAKPAGW